MYRAAPKHHEVLHPPSPLYRQHLIGVYDPHSHDSATRHPKNVSFKVCSHIGPPFFIHTKTLKWIGNTVDIETQGSPEFTALVKNRGGVASQNCPNNDAPANAKVAGSRGRWFARSAPENPGKFCDTCERRDRLIERSLSLSQPSSRSRILGRNTKCRRIWRLIHHYQKSYLGLAR